MNNFRGHSEFSYHIKPNHVSAHANRIWTIALRLQKRNYYHVMVWTLVEPSAWIRGGLALQLHHRKVALRTVDDGEVISADGEVISTVVFVAAAFSDSKWRAPSMNVNHTGL
jgi:hypothetical protein